MKRLTHCLYPTWYERVTLEDFNEVEDLSGNLIPPTLASSKLLLLDSITLKLYAVLALCLCCQHMIGRM